MTRALGLLGRRFWVRAHTLARMSHALLLALTLGVVGANPLWLNSFPQRPQPARIFARQAQVGFNPWQDSNPRQQVVNPWRNNAWQRAAAPQLGWRTELEIIPSVLVFEEHIPAFDQPLPTVPPGMNPGPAPPNAPLIVYGPPETTPGQAPSTAPPYFYGPPETTPGPATPTAPPLVYGPPETTPVPATPTETTSESTTPPETTTPSSTTQVQKEKTTTTPEPQTSPSTPEPITTTPAPVTTTPASSTSAQTDAPYEEATGTAVTEVEDYTTIAPVTSPGDGVEATTQTAVPLPFPLGPETPDESSAGGNMVEAGVEEGMDMLTVAKFVEELLDIRARIKGDW